MSKTTATKPTTISCLAWDLLVLLLPFLGLLPMLLLQAKQIVSRPYGLFFPVAWVFLVLLVLLSRKSVNSEPLRRWTSLLSLLVALATGILSVLWFSPWLAQCSFGFCFLAWAMIRVSAATFERILALSLLIFSTLPVPSYFLERKLDSWGNSIVTTFAEKLFDLFSVYHLFEIPELKLRNHTFNVVEILANPMSIQAMVILAILLGVIWRRSFVSTFASCLSAAIWTLFGKLVFVLALAIFSQNGVDITETSQQYWVLAAIAFFVILMVLIGDSFWHAMLKPIQIGEEGAIFRSSTANMFNRMAEWPNIERKLAPKVVLEDGEESVVPVESREGSVPVGIAMAFGILMLPLAIPTGIAVLRNGLLFGQNAAVVFSGDRLPVESTLPKDFFVGQTLQRYRGGVLGDFSDGSTGTWSWSYRGTGNESLITFYFPVRGWIDPQSVLGMPEDWTRSRYGLQNDASGWPYSESLVKSKNAQSAYIWSSQIRVNGDLYQPTEEEFSDAMSLETKDADGISIRIFDMMNPKLDAMNSQSAVISMIYEVEGDIRDAEKQRVLNKYFEIREILRSRMFGTATGEKSNNPTP